MDGLTNIQTDIGKHKVTIGDGTDLEVTSIADFSGIVNTLMGN